MNNIQLTLAHSQLSGHKGIVDSYAKSCRYFPHITPTKIYWMDTQTIIKRKIKDNWRKKLDLHINVSNFTYKWCYRREENKAWFTSLNIPRKVLLTIMRARTNHTRLNGSLYKIKILNSPNCECKKSIQNVQHLLTTCTH